MSLLLGLNEVAVLLRRTNQRRKYRMLRTTNDPS